MNQPKFGKTVAAGQVASPSQAGPDQQNLQEAKPVGLVRSLLQQPQKMLAVLATSLAGGIAGALLQADVVLSSVVAGAAAMFSGIISNQKSSEAPSVSPVGKLTSHASQWMKSLVPKKEKISDSVAPALQFGAAGQAFDRLKRVTGPSTYDAVIKFSGVTPSPLPEAAQPTVPVASGVSVSNGFGVAASSLPKATRTANKIVRRPSFRAAYSGLPVHNLGAEKVAVMTLGRKSASLVMAGREGRPVELTKTISLG
ncbi:MAG TPA: hypothetical protein V6C52_14560 [Coleofasciculaceae cyanobacterium]